MSEKFLYKAVLFGLSCFGLRRSYPSGKAIYSSVIPDILVHHPFCIKVAFFVLSLLLSVQVKANYYSFPNSWGWAAPSSVLSHNTTSTSIRVDWPLYLGYSNDTEFLFYRFSHNGVISETTTARKDLGNLANGTHIFRVQSCWIYEGDNWSPGDESCENNLAEIRVVVGPSSPPANPPTLNVPSYSASGNYTISWSLAERYRWQEKIGSGAWGAEIETTSSSKGFTGKPSGTYSYRVKACNAAGCSAYSSEKTIDVAVTPGVPSSLTATPNPSAGNVTVQWGGSTGAPSKYDFNYKKSTSSSWINGYDGLNLSHSLSGLAPGTWSYQIRACKTVRSYTTCSNWRSTSSSVIPLPSPQKPQVANGGSLNNTTGSFLIEWVDFWDSGYVLEQKINNSAFSSIGYSSEDYDSDTRYFKSFSALADGVYQYRTRQCNSVGCIYSEPLVINVARTPSKPSSLSVTPAVSDGSFSVGWSSSSNTNSYEIKYKKDTAGVWSYGYPGSNRNYSVANLDIGNYQFSTRACNTQGTFKNCSDWSTLFTGVVAIPSAPTLSLAASDGDGSYNISWSNTTNTTSYKWQESINAVWGEEQTVPSSVSVAVRNVSSGAYSYRVRACNAVGCSAYSTVKTINVAIVGTPTLSVAAVNLVTGIMTIEIGAASGSPTRYEVQQRINEGAWSGNVYSGLSLSPQLPAVSAPGTYTYQARACKVVGSYTNCSGWVLGAGSAVLSTPSVPALTVPASNATGQFLVSWNSVANSNRYELRQNGVLIQNTNASSFNVGENTALPSGSYGYTIKACNAVGCSAESTIKTINVAIVGSVTSVAATADYIQGITTLSLGAASGSPTRYEVRQRINAGAWSNTIYSGTSLNPSLPGVTQPGTYSYQARACKVVGTYTNCSLWILSGNIIYSAPGAAPVMTMPTTSNDGKYIISWSAVNNASTYQLRENNVLVQNSVLMNKSYVNTPKNIEGNYSYDVRACNIFGCGVYSSAKSINVINELSINILPVLPTLTEAPAVSETIDQARNIPGKFEVDNAGQAKFTIPVYAVSGSAGLTPDINLMYSSGSENGIAGYGWSLDVGGNISRCRQTYGIDKNAYPITWSSKDRFCLNGQRLLVVSGSYGGVGSIYRTEIDNNTRITAVGGSEGHPNYFRVEYKNGYIESYGNISASSDSKYQLDLNNFHTVLRWSISERFDSAGNKIIYKYVNDSDGQRIDTVDYAFGNDASRGAYVKFEYENRDDPLIGFVAGHAYKTSKRMKTIISSSNNVEIRRYKINYDQDSAVTTNDNLSRISSIQECVGSICSPSTVFEWALPEFEISEAGTASVLSGGVSDYQFGDINGDGLTDIVWYEAIDRKPNTVHNVYQPRAYRYALGYVNASGQFAFDVQNSFTSDAIYDDRNLYLVDTNNDGMMNIVAGGNDNTNYVNIDIDGDGLVDTLTWLTNNRPWEPYYFDLSHVRSLKKDPLANNTSEQYYKYQSGVLRQKFVTTDHIPSQAEATQWADAQYYLSPEQGGVNAFNNMHLAPIQSLYSHAGDFNGDGRMDIVASAYTRLDDCTDDGNEEGCLNVYAKPVIYTTEKSDSGISLNYYSDNISMGTSLSRSIVVDLNLDGLADTVTAGSDQWYLRINNGLTLGPLEPIGVSAGPFATTDKIATDVAVADLNKDGYPDFIWHSPDLPFSSSTTGAGQGKIKVRYWDPSINNFSAQEHVIKAESYNIISSYTDDRFDWNFSFSRFKSSAIHAMDVNADGNMDLVVTPTTQAGSVRVFMGVENNAIANRIISIEEGLGNKITISYDRVNNSENYVGGDQVYSGTNPQHCTHAADSNYLYTRSMCWDTEVATNSDEFHKNLNEPWHALTDQQQSLKPDAPVFARQGATPVVTNVSYSSPLPNNSEAEKQEAYFYENAITQASGRGFLGFRTFTVVNQETGIRTRTTYRQDWPYTGRPLRTEIFSAAGNLLTESENVWGLVACYSQGEPISGCSDNLSQILNEQGSLALGPLQIFQPLSTTKHYALKDNGDAQGVLLSENQLSRTLDDKGNVLAETTIVSGSQGEELTKTIVNEYSYTGPTWSMQQGRLSRIEASSSNAAYGSIARVSEFDYYTTGSEVGLLHTETIEPDNTDFSVVTTHEYSLGNRVKSDTAANGQVRTQEVAYDTRGRYIDKVYELFTNGTDPDTGIRHLISQVVSRDKYGTPTEVRRYTNSTAFITEKTATTPFGIPYFKADSTGAYTLINVGTGADPQNICPTDSGLWTHTQIAGGANTIQCADIVGQASRMATLGFDESAWSVVDTEYDKLGRVLRSSVPYWHGATEVYWNIHTYDVLGRPTSTAQPYNGIMATTTILRDGNQTTVTNPKAQVRVETRDSLGQIIQVVNPNNGITQFKYDARGNMREMIDPASNATLVTYDLRDRKVSMSDPDKGSWTYRYNQFNEVTCQQDGKGQTSTQRYDIRGRLFSRVDRKSGGSCTDPTGTVEKYSQWTYDSSAYGLGKLSSVYDSQTINGAAQYQKSFAYDNLGRVSTTVTTFPNHLDVVSSHYEKLTYDEYGRVFQVFDAARHGNDFSSNGIQHQYNSAGYLSSVVDAASFSLTGEQQAYYSIDAMDARGNITSAYYGNGVTQQTSYYPDSGLTHRIRSDALISSAPMQNLELVWDEIGNLESRHETGTAEISRNVLEEFGYDSLNRLTTWNTSGDLNLNESASYDGIDNILNKTGVGEYRYGSDCASSANAGPHAVCRTGSAGNYTQYTYDANGNLVSDTSGRTLVFTTFDLPQEIIKNGHTTRFNYGPDRQRYKRTDISSGGTTTTLYIGSVEKVYYPDNTIEWKRSIAGVALITQHLNSSGSTIGVAQRYLLKDHLGSLSLITDEIGGVEQAHYFDPWGQSRRIVTEAMVAQWQESQPFLISAKPVTTRGYTGHEHLEEVGLIHMNGRIYDGLLARFVQADPIIQDPLRIQSLNRYSYVWNNPLNATDPSGFTKCSTDANGNEQCTDDADKTVEDIKVTGERTTTPRNPSTGVVAIFVSGGTSGSSYFMFVDKSQAVKIKADIVQRVLEQSDGSLDGQALQDAIIKEGAASLNAMAILSYAAMDTQVQLAPPDARQRFDNTPAGAMVRPLSHMISVLTGDTEYLSKKDIQDAKFGILTAWTPGLGLVGNSLRGSVPAAVGSGPIKGFLEISSNFKSSKAVQNLTNSKPIDFIFDPISQRFIMGRNSLGHDGIRMAGNIGHEDIVGGSIWKQSGTLMTDQSSGHYGTNWTASIREQFTKFMDQHGVEVTHSATYRK